MVIDFNDINSSHIRSGEKPVTEQAQTNAAQHKTDNKQTNSTQDTVQITDQAQDLQRIQKTISELPVVDTEKVEAIRQALTDGSYKADPKNIAQKIIQFEEDFSSTQLKDK